MAHLATSNTAGQPQVIPVVFAVDDNRLYTPLDEKPKRVEPMRLKRVANLLANPQVAIVADHYDEDWAQLAWVLIKGTGSVVEFGGDHMKGVSLLHAKYTQYKSMPLDHRPLIIVTPSRVTSWGKL